MKLKILKKAWSMNPSNVKEPWFVDTDQIYYGTRGQAKSQALLDNDSCVLSDSKGMFPENISYITIKVCREKEYDIVEYLGQEIPRNEIGKLKRLKEIQNLPDDEFYYVQDGRGYVGNSVLWWGLNGNGYTTQINNAHKYSGKEIKSKTWRKSDIIWLSKHVEENIKQHVDMQFLDKELRV